MVNMPPSLVTLRDGRRVLAKMYHRTLSPITYANLFQAERAACRVGGYVSGWHPYYVVVDRAAIALPERAAKGESA